MADIFLSVVIEETLKKGLSLAAEETRLAWGFKAELKRLNKRFATARDLLGDAENRQLTRLATVENWLKKLKASMCDADDVLDEFAYEILRRKLEIQNRKRDKVRNFFSLSNPLAFRRKMAHKMENINLSLDEIYKEATQDIGLRPIEFIGTNVEPREIRQTHPFVDDSKIEGRDGNVELVVDMLLRSKNDEDQIVVAIVGMAGVGKTTLAQLVYKNEKVVEHFGQRMWVCVSDDFDDRRILNEMLESVSRTKFEMSNIEGMVNKLQEKISGKRYILVLDDVWNEDRYKWEKLVNAVMGINGARGSKILVTTRSDKVVSTVQTSLTHRLVELKDEDSWTMFKKIAFADGGAIETPTLVGIGRTIVRRCRGLPLAIKTIGGLMQSKKLEHEWLSIRDSDIWNSLDVVPVLMLSFNHLPSPSLKMCFAYCSLFPKDYVIEKNNVIQRWMAQGYLQPPQGSHLLMEDVGDSYFNTLLWNSLLQDVQRDEYDNIESCKMHDLVHDLALHVAKNYSICSTASELRDVPEVLHLSLTTATEGIENIPKESTQRLRTLRLPSNLLNNMLGDIKGLREFELTDSDTENLPEPIGKLKHLRYLNISKSNIKSLPSSICKLYNLETLNVSRCHELKFPRDFYKLTSLRHLHMTRPISMPTGIGQLTSLQTLPFFGVGQGNGRRIEELGGLSNLRGELEIYDLQNVRNREEAQKANLSSKPCIQELRFKWEREREREIYNDEDVLEGLQPHSNLKGLNIANFGGENFPSWMRAASPMPVLSCLVKIKLEKCNKCKQMPALGHLPRLTNIEIAEMDNLECIGVEFYGHISHDVAVFPKLRVLSLRSMSNLVEWLGADVFPCLEELNILDCEKLVTAPRHFPAIKKLTVRVLNNSQALEEMSSTMTTLESLVLQGVSGLGIDLVLERLLVNNKFLRTMTIISCEELSHLPTVLENLASLKTFYLYQCPNLMCLPNGLHLPASFERLHINECPKLVVANPNPHKPMSLEDLTLHGFETLTTDWAMLLLSLTGLRTLRIGQFSGGLDYFPWPNAIATAKEEKDNNAITQQGCLQYPFVHLETLRLYGWENIKSLPQQLQQLTALKNLTLCEFDGLESLPEWLGKFSSLQSLTIYQANKLVSLPTKEAMQCLVNLQTFSLHNCPLLEERCKKGTGPEWHKISHIPSIWLNYQQIQ